MTDLRARLTDALVEHGYYLGFSCNKSVRESTAGAIADVLLSLDDIAIVELPQAVPHSVGPFTTYFPQNVAVTDDGKVWDSDMTVGVKTAREIAAALLAAAKTAEEQHD
jgi:hypothetical protein